MLKAAIMLFLGIPAACGPANNATSSTNPNESSQPASSDLTDTIDRSAFEGRWIITAFDGQRPAASSEGGRDRIPSLSFSRTGYGGTAGCNALGGIGTLHRARFYALPGPQTMMGCLGPVAAHETMLDRVMRTSPHVAITPDGGMTLTGGGHRLTLRRDVGSVAPPIEPVPLLVGARFSIHTVDGTFLTPRSPHGDSRPLAFDASEWRATPVCATVSGKWRQDGWTLRGSDIVISRATCAQDGAAIDSAVRAVFASDPHFTIGPNGEFLLAGDGHWIAGERDTLAAERDMPALGGSWDIVTIDGKPPVDRAPGPRSPTIDFGSTAYGGSTGCNTILGSFIARAGRLYTNPGPTTEMGCGALTAQEDRIYKLLRNAPHIGRAGSGVQLSDDKGGMLLRRSDRSVANHARAAPLPARYEGGFIAVNGEPTQVRAGDPTSRVTISGSDVRIDIGCGAVSTFLRRSKDGMSLISNPQTSEGGACAGRRRDQHHLLMRLSNGPVAGIVDGNGDLLLAGDGIWLTARKG